MVVLVAYWCFLDRAALETSACISMGLAMWLCPLGRLETRRWHERRPDPAGAGAAFDMLVVAWPTFNELDRLMRQKPERRREVA